MSHARRAAESVTHYVTHDAARVKRDSQCSAAVFKIPQGWVTSPCSPQNRLGDHVLNPTRHFPSGCKPGADRATTTVDWDLDWDLTSRHFRATHSQLGCAGVVDGIILRFGLPLASRYPNLSNNF